MKAASRIKQFVKTFFEDKSDPKIPAEMWTSHSVGYAKYEIGDWTYGFPIVKDWHQGTTLVVGRYCSIGEGVTILLGGEHKTNFITTFPFRECFPHLLTTPRCGTTKGDVQIGHDVWIGINATILSGVSIGSGAIIAAHSVVTKPVQPYSIVAGNPARHLRFRIPEPSIPIMLRISWWNWTHSEVLKASPLLVSNRLNDFITMYGSGEFSAVIIEPTNTFGGSLS
jgi:acetyltransferase-like isoleucine patch superfamily enzyme